MPVQQIEMTDGVPVAVETRGSGPAVVLVHGFLSSATMNWINPGIADALVAAGFHVIMPELRGHGRSGAPTSPDAYPPDVLAADLEAVVAAMGLSAYDLVGYSLGARTVLRLMVRARVPAPERLVLAGMGHSGLLDSTRRRDWFVDAIRRRDAPDLDTAQRSVVRFLKATRTDPDAAMLALMSQVDSVPGDLSALALPVLVLCGDKDDDNGSAAELAAAIPGARLETPPGTHMSVILAPAFAEALVRFLAR